MTKLVKIGSSYGIRIPKVFIDKAHLRDTEIDLKLQKNGLLLTPNKKYRSNWDSESLRKKARLDENCAKLQSEFLEQDLRDWEW